MNKTRSFTALLVHRKIYIKIVFYIFHFFLFFNLIKTKKNIWSLAQLIYFIMDECINVFSSLSYVANANLKCH
jgi:hypothetical protein